MSTTAAAAVAAALLSVSLAHTAKPRIHTNNRSALVLMCNPKITCASTRHRDISSSFSERVVASIATAATIATAAAAAVARCSITSKYCCCCCCC
eukprot:16058-Heterococcus_DN1.PRE.6